MKQWRVSTLVIVSSLISLAVEAQTADGNAGINQANSMVRSYFDTGVNLMYAVGAVIGLVGAIHVYKKWTEGDRDTRQAAAAWIGGCIFLVVVATVLRNFFGL
jgi:hypothetical protein